MRIERMLPSSDGRPGTALYLTVRFTKSDHCGVSHVRGAVVVVPSATGVAKRGRSCPARSPTASCTTSGGQKIAPTCSVLRSRGDVFGYSYRSAYVTTSPASFDQDDNQVCTRVSGLRVGSS